VPMTANLAYAKHIRNLCNSYIAFAGIAGLA
jgi:hypothetical protein